MAKSNIVVPRPPKSTWMLKAPIQLKEKLDNIRIQRIKNGKDKQMTSYKRLLLAMSRHDKALNDLANADFIQDNRGQLSTGSEGGGSVFSIFNFMIFIFLAVLMFAGFIYIQGEIYNVFHQAGVMNDATMAGQPGYTNMTLAADLTFGQLNQAIQALHMVATAYILGYAIVIILTNVLVRLNPIWFFAYILVSVLAIVFAVPISNAYQALLAQNAFASSTGTGGLAAFPVANYILINLPTLVMILGIIGGIFLFINLIRSGNEGDFK